METTELTWLKSSYSGGGGDNCVEVAQALSHVLVRDSKDTRKPALAVSLSAWQAFACRASEICV
ncbi:DUF397 domain-containing protein [uncultured Streptomyces sp.]|uniref:DUF397 domain-containing protein n=1 Tax=uncultured Streptomyces sp. TaxID=174707 RepID=UPI00261F429C|nr:DUF397 domain-containing protein [uncultured Streptomyces sp.]